ncbi:4Fe-4S binding protein [Desulfosporosinus shakirovi]|uniref:4Fe-4S binding protein n=1 Tax=Desulfosporosinus shakirovi TaxID=2885154 RepID=UPI001E5455BF|nr:4Fe-4S binding protein [Desulfosporosinus sp. SRJS8]MCB8814945.1 4Fe-4S binding protein [Desulfosporosinus sp. SRJS8]
MTVQQLRRILQVGSLLLICLIPVIESYKRLVYHLPRNSIGKLYSVSEELSYLDSSLKGGYLESVMIALDAFLGSIFENINALNRLIEGFSGYFWSITIGGFTVIDPLAVIQVSRQSYATSLDFWSSILLPIVIVLIFGRVFCSWICPFNTLQELTRFVLRKLKIPMIKKSLLTDSYLRFLVLGTGIVLTLLGIAVFPHFLPYVQLGRFFYYLTIGSIYWTGLIFIVAILIVDGLLQKGFWCNYLCPTGALLSLLGRKRKVCVRRNKETCIGSCSLCEKVCVWDSHPKLDEFSNCSNCHLCIDKCPSKALKIFRP